MKSKKLKKKQKGASRKIKPEKHVDKKDNSFDFGGLPQRDLKKNLGCS